MCNVAIILIMMNRIEKQTTLEEIPFHYLYFLIDAIFYELKEMDKLHLKAKKVRILKDLLARFP